jgi:hypothetical protein
VTTIVDPVGISEIAERLGVSRQHVANMRFESRKGRGGPHPFPPEAVVVSNTPIWPEAVIAGWAAASGRSYSGYPAGE